MQVHVQVHLEAQLLEGDVGPRGVLQMNVLCCAVEDTWSEEKKKSKSEQGVIIKAAAILHSRACKQIRRWQ